MNLNSKSLGRRSVVGPFGDVGYIVKRPNHDKATQKRQEERMQNREEQHKIKKEHRFTTNQDFINGYWDKLDTLSLKSAINRMVDLGMKQAEIDFSERQNKLKQLLLEEQSSRVQEYTNKAQKFMDVRFEQTKLKAADIMKRRDVASDSHVQRMYERMAMRDSEAYRDRLRVVNMESISQANKEQIRQKDNERHLMIEEEKVLIAEAGNRCSKEKQQRELEDLAIKEEKRLHDELLKKDQEINERTLKNRACIEDFEEQERQKYQNDKMLVEENMKKVAARRAVLQNEQLMEQIDVNRQLAAQNKHAELLMENILVNDNRKKIEMEIESIKDTRRQAWDELVVFRNYMVQVRNYMVARQQEEERVIEQMKRQQDLKKSEERRALEQTRTTMRMQHVETMKRTAAEKLDRQAELKSMESKYASLAEHFQKKNELFENAHMALRHKQVNTAPANMEYSKYLDVLRERQRLEDREMLERMKRASEERQKRLDANLERRQLGEGGTALHPVHRFYNNRTKV